MLPTLDPALTSKLEVRLYRAPAAAETATTAGNDPTLGAIQSGGVLRVGYNPHAPANMGGPILLAYLMPPGADVLRRYLDQWLELKEADGFRTAQFDYWMKGKPRADRPPRWNLLDALLDARH